MIPPRRSVFVTLLVLLSLFISACGGTPAAPATTTSNAPSTSTVAEASAPQASAEVSTEASAEASTAATAAAEAAEPAAEASPSAAPTLTPAPNAVVLEYWEMPWDGAEVRQELVNDFNRQNPNIYVKYTALQWADYMQKLQGAIGAGTPPDISGTGSGDPFNFDAQGEALPLDEFYATLKSDGRFDDFTDWAKAKFNFNGHYVGVPWQIDGRGIFYRKDLFQQAGIQPPTTHDELLTAATKLTDRAKGQYGICVPGKQGAYDTDQFYMQLVFQNGGALADEQGNPTFNTPEHLEALKFEQELVAAAAPEGAASHSFAELPALYEQGKCAMIFEGSWFPGQLAGEAPEIFEQTGLLPVLKGRGAKATQRIVGFYNPWMIFKQTKHPAEAIKFLDFMMQKDNLKRIYEATGMGPVYKSLSTDPIYAENPLTKELVSQVEQYSVDYWYPNNKAAVGIGTIGTDLSDLVVNPVLVGARSPEDALRDAQEQIGPRFEAQTQ